jgi:hypothetical protein
MHYRINELIQEGRSAKLRIAEKNKKKLWQIEIDPSFLHSEEQEPILDSIRRFKNLKKRIRKNQ